MAKFIPVIIPQPGDDLKAWARQLTSQLQFLGQQLQNTLAGIEQGGGGGGGASTTPITTPGGVTVIDSNGYYLDGLGRVVVDAAGLHVYDAVGFQVIDGPNVYINTEQLVDNAVETAKLAAGAVTEVKIDNDAITAPKIQAGAIVAGKLAANAIVANDGVIGTAAIADAQIANLNANKINAGSIAAERMEANIVTALNGKFATLSALASSLGVVQILSGGALFTQGATAYATGTGVWMGQDDGVYKWRAGNPAGARIQWTGSALEVYNSSNQLTIASGNVDWAGITGAGKPANNATVGATIGSNLIKAAGGTAVATDFVANWNPITSGNITTYISGAAIGTAQIVNASITNAKIDLATANRLIVGTANIGNAAVNTLQIAGNAVIIPRHVITGAHDAFHTGNLDLTLGTFTTSSPGSGVVQCVFSIRDQIAGQLLGTLATIAAASSQAMTFAILRNGVTVKSFSATTTSLRCSWNGFVDTPGPGVSCTYVLRMYSAGSASKTRPTLDVIFNEIRN